MSRRRNDATPQARCSVRTMRLHPDIRFRELRFGHEQAPLMVIDNVVDDPDALVEAAGELQFQKVPRAYPGIRAAAPAAYRQLLTEALSDRLISFFQLKARRLSLSLCHFSLVTLRPDELAPIQRLPHVDTVHDDGLATVHYLFRADLGGTAFYGIDRPVSSPSMACGNRHTLPPCRRSSEVPAVRLWLSSTVTPSISSASSHSRRLSIACSSTNETPCIRAPSRRISCRTQTLQRGACRSTASSTP